MRKNFRRAQKARVLKRLIRHISSWISKNKETVRSVTALLGSNIVSSLLAAVGGLLVARFVGPDDVGAFRAYTIPLVYLTFLHLGTWDGLWRQIPYYVGKERPAQVEKIASTAGAFNFAVSVAVSVAFLLLAGLSLVQGNYYGVFGWLSQAVFSWGVFYGGYLTSTYRTLNHFVNLAKIQGIQAVLSFGMVFLLPVLQFYGLCARAAVPSLIAVLLFHRGRPLRIPYRLDLGALTKLVKLGLPYSIWGNLYTSVWLATESALVLSMSGVTALGLFAVAAVVRQAVSSLPMAISKVLLPRVVISFARMGTVRAANAHSIWVALGLTGFMVFFAVTGSLLLEVLVPIAIPKYVDAIPAMKICLWFPVVQAASLPINTLFATGRPWLWGRSVIAGVVIFPIATYFLEPKLGGLLAVVVGSLLGHIARAIAAYIDLVALTQKEKQ